MTHAYHCPQKCCLIQVTELGKDFSPQIRRGHCRKAGVFIYDPDEERVLLVQSRGQLWGPPKGTLEMDRDETSYQCAVREVKEETGLDITVAEFTRAVRIKNRAMYYYAERKTVPVEIQHHSEDNDANGITWIRLSCLEECIKAGHIIINQHCRMVFKKFLGREFPDSDFVKVQKRRK